MRQVSVERSPAKKLGNSTYQRITKTTTTYPKAGKVILTTGKAGSVLGATVISKTNSKDRGVAIDHRTGKSRGVNL